MSIERTSAIPELAGSARQRVSRRRRAPWRTFLHNLGIVTVLFFFLFPIIYLAAISLKSQDDVLNGQLLPTRLAFENWVNAYQAQPIGLLLRNSLVVAISSALLTLLIAVPSTYAMARFNVGGQALHSFVLSSYVAPPIVTIIPLFFLLRTAGLVNTLPGLVLVYALANLPVAIWLLDSFIRDVPLDIEEAALVDGAGTITILTRIVIPLIAPGIVAAGIICLILTYNEFLFALILTYGPESQTLPVGIALFQGDRLVQFGQIAAASLTAIVPVYVVALFFQRWLIRGLTSGSVK